LAINLVDGEVLADVAQELEHRDRAWVQSAFVDQRGLERPGSKSSSRPSCTLMHSTVVSKCLVVEEVAFFTYAHPVSPTIPVAPPANGKGGGRPVGSGA
jgi:hypothetical protein